MLAIAQLGEEAYGASILEELDWRTGRDIKGGAIYMALKRLEEKGMISSRVGPPTAERGGRTKRLVRLEPAGVASLRTAHVEWNRMTAGLDTLLGDA